MNKKLINEFEKILNLAGMHGFTLDFEKEIPYGLSLKFRKNDEITNVNIYYSKKKGISHVISGKKKQKTTAELKGIILIDKSEKKHKWEKWVGTDESGKGDFFGPLVVAGFLCDSEIADDLIKKGVADSKKISDKKIEKLAKYIYAKYRNNIETVILKPKTYNNMYNNFRSQGKKLNELLAWMHARAILNLESKHHFEGAIIDKFASNKILKNSLSGLKNINLEAFVRAESDVAVAAASIIARYHFVNYMKEMSKEFNVDFHKGASKSVIEDGKNFVEKFGIEKVSLVAKTHFKTLDKIK